MNRRMLAAAAAAALGLALGSAGNAEARSAYQRQMDKYLEVDVATILWGNESDDESQIGHIHPPRFTRNPDRVEIVEFMRHMNHTWRTTRRLTDAWRESLPPEVDWRPMPRGRGGAINRKKAVAVLWHLHQELWCTAQLFDREAQAHEIIARISTTPLRKRTARTTLDKRAYAEIVEHFSAEFIREIGIDAAAFADARARPEVPECINIASQLNRDRSGADNAAGAPLKRPVWEPAFVINGKYTVSASWIKDPAEVYRIANRLIRLELEAGRAHDGPTNDEELAEWLAPRSGEVFSRVRFGKRIRYKGVYNAEQRELWALNEDGSFRDTAVLQGTGDDSYWYFVHPKQGVRELKLWMRGRQYVSYTGEDGQPVRHGAFLLTDWLTAPGRGVVSLPFRRPDHVFLFGGKAEAHVRRRPRRHGRIAPGAPDRDLVASRRRAAGPIRERHGARVAVAGGGGARRVRGARNLDPAVEGREGIPRSGIRGTPARAAHREAEGGRGRERKIASPRARG